mmetsp:Transcript_64799/g.97644  ORF Transcript_64799/g.97644 Transcript_64799/m.97644 type:complete len:239 (+) Transcript_64799:36-752(+)
MSKNKLEEKTFLVYQKQMELAVFLTEISFLLGIDKKNTRKALYLLGISRKFLKISDSLSWFLVFYFCLVLKIEEKTDQKSNSASVCKKVFSEKHYSPYFSPFRKGNEKTVTNFKVLVFFIENFILKAFRFKVHFRLGEELYFPFWKKLGCYRKHFSSIITYFRKCHFLKKPANFFFATFFLDHSSLKCFSVSKIWFTLNEFSTLYPWWRFLKTRECEMEFFEQKAVFECCSTMNRKNL